MKKYLSNSIIWSPLLAFVCFLSAVIFLSTSSWFDMRVTLILGVLSALLCCWTTIPSADDLGFIASSNATLESYLRSLIRRNLWFHGACFLVLLFTSGDQYNLIFSFDAFMVLLLMIANSIVLVGIRINSYTLLFAYSVLLVVGLLIPSNLYLVVVCCSAVGAAALIYPKVLLERDLV